ncbi:methyltransferase domain-containing protein [Aurantibacter sp.]|uniref:methyltransferase domain-containing protein n=1 Tax=Aurantibacter sp. TaxID=2807103 RepID=UPI003264C107
MDFTLRHSEEELMDDSQISLDDLRATYFDINRANAFLGGNKVVLIALKSLVLQNIQDSLSVIDVGCGDGAMLRVMADFFRKENMKVEFLGIDINEKAIQLAREASKSYPEIKYNAIDVLKTNGIKADVVITTLTMHHIAETDIYAFLKALMKMSRMGIVISDLHRSRIAYYLFKLFSVIFIKTKIAKNDGLVSIRSGFTKQELKNYSKSFPTKQHAIKWKWAFRLNWVIRFNEKEINE